uniref:Uncharacterized protein n=1 Tax=Physcomitrium patens TaxID=3218 RepID=A0A2K1IMH9_PHYPA|nr:hypothetical protein PHYPA_026795 [Physcomitrium patens]
MRPSCLSFPGEIGSPDDKPTSPYSRGFFRCQGRIVIVKHPIIMVYAVTQQT